MAQEGGGKLEGSKGEQRFVVEFQTKGEKIFVGAKIIRKFLGSRALWAKAGN
jgi:hypothetical protein